MKKLKLVFMLVLSVSALAGAIYLGYHYFYLEYLADFFYEPEVVVEPEPEPEPDPEPEPEPEPDEPLPPGLEEEMEQRRQHRQQLFDDAVAAHRVDNLAEALNLYEEVIALGARDLIAARSYRYLGDIYAARDNYEEALENYQFALELVETESIFHYRLGQVLWELDERDRAGEAFERAIELEDDVNYYLARGNLSVEEGNYAQAIEFFENGLEAGEDARLYLNLALARRRQREPEGAIDAYEAARRLGVNPGEEYRIAMNLGEIHLENGNFDRAADEFEQALNLERNAEVFYNLGRVEIERQNFDLAGGYLRNARELAPGDIEILIDLGYVLEQVGDYYDSIEAYQEALEIEPDNEGVYLALGRLHEWTDRPREALEYYRELVERGQPGEELAMVYRRVGELFLQFDEPSRAIDPFRNVLRMVGADHEVYYNLGLAYFRANEEEEAIRALREAVELQPGSEQYRMALAEVLYHSGYHREAREQFHQISTINPDNLEARYMNGYLYYKRGDLVTARERLQDLIADSDDDQFLARIYQALGSIYLKEEEYSSARTSFRQALEHTEEPEIYYNLGLVFIHQQQWESAAASLERAKNIAGEDSRILTALGFVLQQMGMYERSRQQFVEALSLDPENARARWNLRQVERRLEGERE